MTSSELSPSPTDRRPLDASVVRTGVLAMLALIVGSMLTYELVRSISPSTPLPRRGRAPAARLRLLQPIQLDSCRPTPRRRQARPAGSRASYAPPPRWSGGADARAGSHSSTVPRCSQLRTGTVAVRGGPFSLAKSRLKLVAPTEVNRTVAPTRRPNADFEPGST
jgi:hypothetical protein